MRQPGTEYEVFMIRLGYLGPKGTFSQEAAENYIKKKAECHCVDYSTIPDLISAVQNGELEEAIVPIENSLEGAVNTTMDMLAGSSNLMIKGEVVLPIHQNLLVAEGTSISGIKYILSHPQGIGQCRKYISENFPQAEIQYIHSTAAAAEAVARGRAESAAVGSAAAALAYGLRILAAGIQDGNNNMTRFVVVSTKEEQRTGKDRTSIVFSTEDKSGSLYRVLDIFNLWDINMTRIESRPAKNQLGSYIFFVDIEGHREDENVRDALTMVKRKTSFYKFLGSYPIDRIEV